MAAGIRIYSSDGQKIVFDSSFHTTVVLGNGSTGTTNGSLPADDRLLTGTFWVSIIGYEHQAKGYAQPRFYTVGNKLYWDFDSVISNRVIENGLCEKVSINFIYGVY